jgi:hypothetical protein
MGEMTQEIAMVMFDILVPNGESEDAKGKNGLERKLRRAASSGLHILKRFSLKRLTHGLNQFIHSVEDMIQNYPFVVAGFKKHKRLRFTGKFKLDSFPSLSAAYAFWFKGLTSISEFRYSR